MNKLWVTLGIVLWFVLPRAEAEPANYYDEGEIQLLNYPSYLTLTAGQCPVKKYFNEGYEYAYKNHKGEFVGCYIIQEKVRGKDAVLYLKNWNNEVEASFKQGEWGRPKDPITYQTNLNPFYLERNVYNQPRTTTTCVPLMGGGGVTCY